MKRFFIALCLIACMLQGAWAQTWTQTFPNGYLPGSGTVTRPANTTAYVAGQLVCAFVSGTVCAAIPLKVVRPGSTGVLNSVKLTKTGSSTTNASFVVWFFSAPPTVTSLFDATAYNAPPAGDWVGGAAPAAAVLGNATCSTPYTTIDSKVGFICTLSGPGYFPILANVANTQANAAISSNIYALIMANGAYTPISGETFSLNVGGFDD